MEFSIDEHGHLIFTLDAEAREELKEKMSEDFFYADIEDIFHNSDLSGNCDLDTLRPEQVGALTDSPIFAEGIEHDPDGVIGRTENVWWYPNYQIENPAEILINTGEVMFTAAPENASQKSSDFRVLGDDNLLLQDTDSLDEAKRWISNYTRTGDFGGHNVLMVLSRNDVIEYKIVSDSEA